MASDTTEVDKILQRHKGLEGNLEFAMKPMTEAGEIFGNLDNPRLINMNTDLNKEERRSLIIIDELRSMGLWFEDSEVSQSFKEKSVSLNAKGADRKKEIAQGMLKSRSGGAGLSALFQRQPAEPITK